MKAFEINTTAYSEENFTIVTDLSELQILDVISPIVIDERDNDVEYLNEDLINALVRAYPKNKIILVEPTLISV